MPASLDRIIERVSTSRTPSVEFVRSSPNPGHSLGILSASFNPPTIAHLELLRLAADQFSIEEKVALAGTANADKTAYECSLQDRLRMLDLSLDAKAAESVAVSSHAYFVDIADATKRARPGSDLHFIIGFDTFERVLDSERRYFLKYHRTFRSSDEALEYLASMARLIVAGRADKDEQDIKRLLGKAPESLSRVVSILNLPRGLANRSASEVRSRLKSGESIAGLVVPEVETFILKRALYR